MSADLFAKYNCTYCQDDIPGIRVKCVECSDLDLCLQCFSAGAEIGTHKNNHPYQFVNSEALELFRSKSGWTAGEELLLLNGIEKYGFGNWEDIAQFIKTRTAEEAKEEYMNRYLDGSIGRATWAGIEHVSSLKEEAPLEPILGQHLPPLDLTPQEATELGNMPHRDDFEREYDNEAESLVTTLNIKSGEDSELDIAFKLAQIDMYIMRLRERVRRKRVCQDYQLVSQFFSSRRDRPKPKLPQVEQEVEEKLRGVCQFLTSQELECLVKNIARQKKLAKRMSQLLKYRRNGLTKLEEMAHFEQESAERESPSSFLGTLSSSPSSLGDKKKRRKRRGRILFNHKKFHVPHRQPYLIAAARAAAAAAAAANASSVHH